MQAGSVVKEFLTTAADHKNYQSRYYNLDAIIAVGKWVPLLLSEVKLFKFSRERSSKISVLSYSICHRHS